MACHPPRRSEMREGGLDIFLDRLVVVIPVDIDHVEQPTNVVDRSGAIPFHHLDMRVVTGAGLEAATNMQIGPRIDRHYAAAMKRPELGGDPLETADFQHRAWACDVVELLQIGDA